MKVIPVRYVETKNIIICRKVDILDELKQIERQVAEHVQDMPTKKLLELKRKEIYGMRINGVGPWTRCCVDQLISNQKDLRRNYAHIQALDRNGKHTFKADSRHLEVREINDETIKNKPHGLIKTMMYGVGKVLRKNEFRKFFDVVKGKHVDGVFGLIPENYDHDDRSNDCYAADFFYKEKNCEEKKSFRQLLINNKIVYPRKVDTDLNQAIFWEQEKFLIEQNGWTSMNCDKLPSSPQQLQLYGEQSTQHTVISLLSSCAPESVQPSVLYKDTN